MNERNVNVVVKRLRQTLDEQDGCDVTISYWSIEDAIDCINKLEETIRKHNQKMKAMPIMKWTPESPEVGLRLLADWFDEMYPGDSETQVQDDLRLWADKIERLENEQILVIGMHKAAKAALSAVHPKGGKT